jgi:hypothetical protein
MTKKNWAMTKYLNAEQVEALRKIDIPTICNLLEMVAPDRRGVGYTTKYLHCVCKVSYFGSLHIAPNRVAAAPQSPAWQAPSARPPFPPVACFPSRFSFNPDLGARRAKPSMSPETSLCSAVTQLCDGSMR